MSHTREEEWKQVRALHLVRDERDREVGAAAKGRAGDAVLAASQLFAAVCLLRGDPAWAAFLSLTFVGGGAQCLHRFWEDRERFFLICGLGRVGLRRGAGMLVSAPGPGDRAVPGAAGGLCPADQPADQPVRPDICPPSAGGRMAQV